MTAPGRAARAKGHRAERAVVAWLRAHGHPDAATTRHRLGHDGWHAPGDVIGVPGLVIECKAVAASSWGSWCRQAEEEANGTPWCVVRRQPGVTDVGAWPCVASLDAIGGPIHHSTLSLIQIVRRIDALPAGHWLAGRDGYAAGRFGDLFDEAL